METIGAYEAKTHFSELLKRVAQGERITITKHGAPVATLQPAETNRREPVQNVVDQIRAFRQGHILGELSIAEMIAEGRR